MTLSGGRYESLSFGTIVSDIALEVSGNRDRLVLERFTGRDAGRGQLAAKGNLDLAATPLLARRTAGTRTLAETLFVLAVLADDRTIERTYLMGQLAHARTQ